MDCRTIKFFGILLVLILVTGISSGFAYDFNIMTEEYPPFNYTENGKLTGISSEIVAELVKKMKLPDKIQVLPWSRAYRLIQEKDGQILFSTTRTEKRENLFKWVGPLAGNTWVFYAKKGTGMRINSLDDAKKVDKIGTYRDDAAELFLKEQGFTNLDSVIDDEHNVLKLNARRIDLWMVSDLIGAFRAKRKGINPAEAFEIVYKFKEVQLYIAFSKNTNDAVIAKWQDALDEMKANGSYDQILAKYR